MTFRITDSPMWELGTFRPSLPRKGDRCQIIEDAFDEWLQDRITHCYSVHARSPDHGWSLANEREQDDWHIDGTSKSALNLYVAFWSNGLGTEMKDPRTGKEYQNEPFQVVLADNMHFLHRTPRYERHAQIENRWFARAFFYRKARIKDVPGVYQLTL